MIIKIILIVVIALTFLPAFLPISEELHQTLMVGSLVGIIVYLGFACAYSLIETMVTKEFQDRYSEISRKKFVKKVSIVSMLMSLPVIYFIVKTGLLFELVALLFGCTDGCGMGGFAVGIVAVFSYPVFIFLIAMLLPIIPAYFYGAISSPNEVEK